MYFEPEIIHRLDMADLPAALFNQDGLVDRESKYIQLKCTGISVAYACVALEMAVKKILRKGMLKDLKSLEVDAWMFERDPKLEK